VIRHEGAKFGKKVLETIKNLVIHTTQTSRSLKGFINFKLNIHYVMAEQSRKRAVVTGATGGIGKVMAQQLAASGHEVIMVGRKREWLFDIQRGLISSTGNRDIHAMVCDLSVRRDVEQLIQNLKGHFSGIDLLFNNAGGWFPHRLLSVDGIERTLALNYLSWVQLTEGLLPLLQQSPSARIINTSSEMSRYAKPHLDDIQYEKEYSAWQAYGASKIYGLMYTISLAERLAGSGVSVHAFHPGMVRSGFGKDVPGFSGWFYRALRPVMHSPEQGADTGLWLAETHPLPQPNGGYYKKRNLIKANPMVYDKELRLSLESLTRQLLGMPH
jgi:NAD(P)-dependent dehydrogenase (short-subunit alcohol dehydrogenase family)